MDWLLSLLSALWLTLFPASAPTPPVSESFATTTAEVIQVVDGDTIRVSLNGQVESVRYLGIDTPEPYRDGEPACYSLEASERNRELVAGKTVELVRDELDRDKYDRLLRYIYLDDVFINEVLVAEGYADTLNIPPNSAKAEVLARAKQQAITQNLGLWSECE